MWIQHVKRLSISSVQGVQEFKNELGLVGVLMKLLGFCIASPGLEPRIILTQFNIEFID